MRLTRFGAMLSELRFDLRLELLRWRERRILVRMGAAAADMDLPRTSQIAELLERIGAANLRMAELRRAIASSTQGDQADFPTVSHLIQPVVILRGLCTRVILRHQIAALGRSLSPIHEALARVLMQSQGGRTRVPEQLAGAVQSIRRDLDKISEERRDRLAPFGGSTLPKWFPHVGGEATQLSRALWLQLKPNVLPKFPALIGLTVGWWIADTYTTSHFKSVLHSLGIGGGGRRVVSGETYRALLFWLPIMAAGVCAYLADRAKLLIQRRYVPPVPDKSGNS
jgi:hypothetical protein